MASITLDNITKSYGTGAKANQVIHGVSAQIKDGEFIVMVGPSGCGKSTLLRMVAGLEEITGGQISIGNRVVNKLDPAERDIAMVFQNYALYPHMSVFDNMAYGLKIKGVPLEEIKQRVDKAAKMLEIGQYLDRKPAQLSGGQRQRVAMGRAIVRKPQVFLFDEPLSNLDAKLRASTRLQIQQLHRDLGITSLFVTHDQVEAMTLGQRLMVLNSGHVEQLGTPDEVYHFPASTFVASFIGSPPMNLLAAKDATDLIALRADSMSADGLFGTKNEAIATVGVRPEHLRVMPQGLPLQVLSIEMLGAERLLYTRLGNSTEPNMIVRISEGQECPAIGSTIHVQALAGKLHGFDAKGKRIG
ncbi:sn-glycerol-3-phosphate ABC transporter ATP-binding protein UgpC [Variovorax sp. PCZ-1]|uniref:sn-glycerol-3-phosphate ABC transporter ATP-binding protein UgpC n=1 Tax=Variovorax sp. PCZ-1 TaxID=2835533 RepID=UPI001BCBFD52|nr:sn-glycerol-3-phosphate ABC transporter ATP-binding protein UgpC [Variovorax sp. PCZ-1]MBS7808015.1 sn-glycerol-3-phosphate ABC transporter ATP-binding protein UgpC [Variovorax sp. PCZ-1]